MPYNPVSQVLSVDDDDDAAEILGLLMTSHQVEVTSARSGAEALAKIKSNCFDLYLLDVWLPLFDGFELCRQIREFDSKTPILFYSGAAYDSDKQKAFAAGATGYVTKPDVEDLIDTMLELIAKAKIDNAPGHWVGDPLPAAERPFGSFFSLNTASD
jgi:CheY-like chemotaxis protein